MKLLIINGPNLNMLGIREPDIYGKESFPALENFIMECCNSELSEPAVPAYRVPTPSRR